MGPENGPPAPIAGDSRANREKESSTAEELRVQHALALSQGKCAEAQTSSDSLSKQFASAHEDLHKQPGRAAEGHVKGHGQANYRRRREIRIAGEFAYREILEAASRGGGAGGTWLDLLLKTMGE